MATYSEWLGTTKTAFANAMSSAYTNRNTAGNDFYLAWQDMTATSDLSSILPPGSTAFWNTGGPSAGEAEIILFRDWLQDNPVTAGRLGLEPTLAFRSELRSALGNAGTIGGEKRRWKGKPLYTFANGVVVGKDGNIAAAIGTEGGTDIEGFGTDTISFFDGIPFATGTGTPGSTVFAGDTVHSGSIRGTGGVVIIPDVIQLEQDDSITSPAGIGVDSAGKIRLRHRGEGFLDLVDEIATAETDATNAAKLFTAAQNTSSGRFGMSLIPNSNFSYKSIDPTTFTETFANIISVGTTSNILSEPNDGVGEFEANAGGICFTAFPTTSERYAVRIRFEGDVVETTDDSTAPEGLFVTFNETTDDLPDGKYYVFNDANIGPSSGDYEGSEVHTSNVTVVTPLLSDGGYATTDGGGNVDGLTISNSMSVRSFLYKPSAGAKNASMVIFAKNFGAGSDRSIRIDYIVLNESPQTTSEIDSIVDLAVTDIVGEDDLSIVPDKHMADKTQWATRGTSVTLTDTDDGGNPAEDAIQAVFGSGGGGIISSAIQCESDRYLVGCKIKVTDASSGDPVISMFSIENLSPAYPTIGGADTSPITSGNENGINIMEVSAGNSYSGTATSSVTLTDDGSFHTLLGTYETTVTYMDDQGSTYTTYDPARTPHGTTPIQLPSVFSLGIQVDKPCTLLVDYVYGRIQGSSVNIVEGLATAAYTDAEGFVTAMNELVIKESGSIITNSSMGYLNSEGKPSGWATPSDCTLTFDNTGDYAITISKEVAGTRRLVTPTFNLGTADKFSVGIRIKSTTSSAITPVIKIATSTESIIPSPYSTIAESDGGTTNVIYVGGTSIADTLTMSPSSTTAGNYETMLSTWNRTSETEQAFVGGMASVIIECPDNFTVDYVFVKEQTVSYDLADAQAIARKNEAIAQAAGFVADIGDSIAAETGSLLTNADFTSWYKEGGIQRPQKWLLTRGATNAKRAIRTTEVSNEIYAQDSTSRDAETIDDVSQTGSSIRFSPSGNSGGILSAKWQLPIQDVDGVNGGTATTGAYTLTARVKVGSASVIGVRLYAHESFDYTDAAQEHVFCKDGTYGSDTVEGADRTATGTPLDTLFMFADGVTTGQVTRVGVINISNPNDTTPGYDPNYTNDGVDNDYADNPNTEGFADDQFVEYIPLDTDGSNYEDGDLDSTIENHNLWYDIGGTFKPDAKTKCVSFEILIDGDPDSSGGAPSNVYVDYVSLVQQPFDSDFASALADARITTNVGTFSGSGGYSGMNIAQALNLSITSLQQVESDLADEIASSSIIPDSFFQDNTSGESNTWMPTRSASGTVDVDSGGGYGETGTYASLPAGTDHTVGMLSKHIARGDLFATGTNPFFNVVVRLRDQTDASGEEYSVIVIAHEWFSSSAPTNDWVYANGGIFTLSSEASAVSRYNTGADGQAQILDGIGATLIGSGTADGEVELTQGDASWKTVAFEYQANASTKYVSFEIVINEDYDSDGDADVLIDGVLLQQATDQTLVNTLADTQILATDFTSGGTLYAQNSGFASTIDDLSSATGDIVNIETNLGTVATSIGDLVAAANETALVNEQIASEVATLIGNGGFSDGLTEKKHIPLGFIPHAHTYNFIRYLSSSDTTLTKTDAYDSSNGGQTSTTYNWDLESVVNGYGAGTTGYTEITNAPYYDGDGNGFGVAFGVNQNSTIWDTQNGMAGFYTKALSLPNLETQTHTVTTSHSSTATEATTTEGARYTIAFRVKPLLQTQEFAIVAHEYDTDLGPSTSGGYIKAAIATNPTTPVGGSYTANMTYAFGEKHGGYLSALGMEAFDATRNIILDVLKLSDGGDSSRQAFESCSADTWHTVGGTYTATGTAKCVSFSLLARTNPTSTTTTNWITTLGGLYTNPSSHASSDDGLITTLCDFAYMEPQLMNADMVENIAALRAADVQNTLDDSLTTLEGNLGVESNSLMPNGNFAQTFEDSSVEYVKNWIPTGDGASNKLRLFAADSASKSIGTYIKFDKDATDPSAAPYGENISGIISKAIMNPSELVRDLDGNINAFNIGMRIRGTTDIPSPTYSQGARTQSYTTRGTDPSGALDTSTMTLNTWGDLTTGLSINGVTITSVRGDLLENYQNHSSYGNNTAYRIDGSSQPITAMGGTPIRYDMGATTGKALITAFFGCTFYGSDPTRYLWLEGIPTGSTVDIFTTTDGGSNYTKRSTTYYASTGAYYLNIANILGGITSGVSADYGFALAIYADPTSHTASFNTDWDLYVRTYHDDNHMWISKSTIIERFEPNVPSQQQPDFAVKLIAHESYEAISDPNTIVRGANVLASSPHAQVGPSLSPAFSSGLSDDKNLIDLRYSGSTSAETQADNGWITIDASVVDDDSGEYITDWRHIVGSYVPNEATTAVSFEILVDHNKDNDPLVQEVWLDSITMAASSVGTDLAATIADNRVFVEQKFQGGVTPLDPLNVVRNGDMSEVFQDTSVEPNVLRPKNFFFTTSNSTLGLAADWTYLQVSPDSTDSNRAITIPGGEHGSTGILSRPFRISSTEYKIRVAYSMASTSSYSTWNNANLYIQAHTTNATLNSQASAIRQTSSFYLWPTSGEIFMDATSPVAIDYKSQLASEPAGGVHDVTIDSTVRVIEFTWNPLQKTSTTRPSATDLPESCSLEFSMMTSNSPGACLVNIWEFSAVPVGKVYPSYAGAGNSVYGTTFDNEGDPAPDEPRETEAAEALYNTIDIQVTDTTAGSIAKNRLLMALPRKVYTAYQDSTPNVDTSKGTLGTSYLYPGVSDLLYEMQNEQASVVILFFAVYKDVGDARNLIFPTDSHNSIKGINSLIFNRDANLSSNTEVSEGFYMNSDTNTAENATGDRVIANLGIIDFDRDYNPRGCLGYDGFGTSGYGASAGTSNSQAYLNGIGSMIRNVKSLYVGTSWGEASTGADVGFGLDAIISGAANNYMNGLGTSLGNGDSNSSTPSYWQNRYNRAGGIYIKQSTNKHGVHFIDNDSAARTVLGYSGTNFAFNYAADENTALTEIGYLLNNSDVNQITFTGQHRNYAEDLTNEDIGMIVVSTGVYKNVSTNTAQQKPSINEALPIVKLSDRRNQKACFGVVSNAEDPNDDVRTYQEGRFVSTFPKEEGDERLIINSLGEGAVWICNINGNLENGDYITTCEIPGYGMLQDDDLLHNYTVAKITQDCNFELDNPYYDCVEFEFEGQTYRKAFVGCTYHCG